MTSKSRSARTPEIEVCHGHECSDCGGRELSRELEALGLNTIAGDCRNQCPNAPLVLVDGIMITKATVQKVQDRLQSLQA